MEKEVIKWPVGRDKGDKLFKGWEEIFEDIINKI